MGPPPRVGVSCRGGCGSSRLLAWCFLLVLSRHAPGSRGAEAVWTAYLNVSWRVPHPGVNRTVWELSEEGVYGQDSPLEPVAGVLVPPDGPGALNACNPLTNFTVPTIWGSAVQVSWLALIQRGGGCTFADKIHLAYERGASGAVIFNFPGTRNEVIPMSHPGAGDIVAIMIGNLKGMKILQSIQRGIQVTMVIEVGKKHGPWVNHYSIFFVSVSFFIIMAATVGYFIFYSARRLQNARAQSRKQSLKSITIMLDIRGTIVFISENVLSLLGYDSVQLMGNMLTNIISDEEKDEVLQKIILTFPLVGLVGAHFDFCCNIKKGQFVWDNSSPYEYVKFLLTLQNAYDESFVFFGSMGPDNKSSPSPGIKLLWEQQYYLVGTISVLSSQMLKMICNSKEDNKEIVAEDPKDDTLLECRSPGKPCCLEPSEVYYTTYESSSDSSSSLALSFVKVKRRRVKKTISATSIISDTTSDTSVSSTNFRPPSETSRDIDPRLLQSPVDIEFVLDSDSDYVPDSPAQVYMTKAEMEFISEIKEPPGTSESLAINGVKEDLTSGDSTDVDEDEEESTTEDSIDVSEDKEEPTIEESTAYDADKEESIRNKSTVSNDHEEESVKEELFYADNDHEESATDESIAINANEEEPMNEGSINVDEDEEPSSEESHEDEEVTTSKESNEDEEEPTKKVFTAVKVKEEPKDDKPVAVKDCKTTNNSDTQTYIMVLKDKVYEECKKEPVDKDYRNSPHPVAIVDPIVRDITQPMEQCGINSTHTVLGGRFTQLNEQTTTLICVFDLKICRTFYDSPEDEQLIHDLSQHIEMLRDPRPQEEELQEQSQPQQLLSCQDDYTNCSQNETHGLQENITGISLPQSEPIFSFESEPEEFGSPLPAPESPEMAMNMWDSASTLIVAQNHLLNTDAWLCSDRVPLPEEIFGDQASPISRPETESHFMSSDLEDLEEHEEQDDNLPQP